MSTTTTTTTPTRSRHETVNRFLAALAGSAGRGELLELRYRLDDGQRMGQVFDRPTRLRGLATRAVALGRRTDVYLGQRAEQGKSMSETGTPTAVSETSLLPDTVSAAATSIEWIREFVQRWLEAWNSHEVDRLLALMTDDIEYRQPRPLSQCARRGVVT